MTAQTIVRYNGVEIGQCLTKTFEQTPIYSDDDADLIGWKFNVTVQGFCHGQSSWSTAGYTYLKADDVPVSGGSAAAIYNRLRERLQSPRGQFQMIVGADAAGNNGQELLAANAWTANETSPANNPSADINNGPKPRKTSITIVGDNVFKVEWSVEIQLTCTGNTAGILSNRWSFTDDIDKNLRTTRTYTGRLRLATSQLNHAMVRRWVLPHMVPLMRRDSMRFTSSSDGLLVDYTIVDRETPYSAPFPATSWEFSHREETGDGKVGFCDVQISMEAPSTADKQHLIKIGLAAVRAKFSGQIAQGKLAGIVESIAVTDLMGDDTNRIIVEGRCTRPMSPAEFQTNLEHKSGVPLDREGNFKTIAVNYESARNAGARFDGPQLPSEGPVAAAGIIACALQTPCDDAHAMARRTVSGNAPDPEPPPEDVTLDINRDQTAEQIEAFFDAPSYVTDGHVLALFVHYRMTSTYVLNGMKVALPIARPATNETSESEPDETVRVVSLGPQTAKRIVRIEAQRAGAEPFLPRPADYVDASGIKAVLLNSKIMAEVPDRTTDGQLIHIASGEYEYSLSRPPRGNEKLRIGINPWDRIGGLRESIVMLNFTEDELAGGGSSSGGGQT
jgi:hypothetical protein